MNSLVDAYLRQGLKNWAAPHHPPKNGRARLLLVAASPPIELEQPITSRDTSGQYSHLASRIHMASICAIDPFNRNTLWALELASIPLSHRGLSGRRA